MYFIYIYIHTHTHIYIYVYIHTHTHIYDSGDGGGLVVQSCPTPVTPWILVCYAPLSMGFFRQEYWSGLPLPSPVYDSTG